MQKRKILIEELSEDLELLLWEFGKKFIITETFIKCKLSYKVDDLQVDMEDNCIFFSDCENMLVNNYSVLIGFVADSLLSIEKNYGNKDVGIEYDLKFNNGLVKISVI